MNPTPLVMLDTIGQAFDEAGIRVAPIVTFDFANEVDFHNFVTRLEKCLNKYSVNPIVLRIEKNEINRFNDVFCRFIIRS